MDITGNRSLLLHVDHGEQFQGWVEAAAANHCQGSSCFI